ncbi:hypothetical protein HanIR_Chr09g0396021 [Helianthus annuus]|nr:hypothetical protein HanIR_Chr09g0396021 [Helianthus annuus]
MILLCVRNVFVPSKAHNWSCLSMSSSTTSTLFICRTSLILCAPSETLDILIFFPPKTSLRSCFCSLSNPLECFPISWMKLLL